MLLVKDIHRAWSKKSGWLAQHCYPKKSYSLFCANYSCVYMADKKINFHFSS